MCNIHKNNLFGGSPVDRLLRDAGNDLDTAYSNINKIGTKNSDYVGGDRNNSIRQEVIMNAQTDLTKAKQQFDLFQEMKKMINQIYDTIIRNINPR